MTRRGGRGTSHRGKGSSARPGSGHKWYPKSRWEREPIKVCTTCRLRVEMTAPGEFLINGQKFTNIPRCHG